MPGKASPAEQGSTLAPLDGTGARLRLSFAIGNYDRVRALTEGRVRVDGVDLLCLSLTPEETFFRQLVHHEFDVSEMSLGSYVAQKATGDDSFVGIPVFPSRCFRHSGIFVNTSSGIERPEDLRGKRVGVPEYQMTALTWIRGMLLDDYGVHPRELQWLTGGLHQTGRREKVSLSLPAEVKVDPIPADSTLSEMLEAGELDAVMTARLPESFVRRSPAVRRLFPDFRKVESDYFRRTGIFPIMHTVVIRRELYERHRWVAQSLRKALAEAKNIALSSMYDTTALPTMLPWMHEEIESVRTMMGDDWWPYGFEQNRKQLETFVRYSFEQGIATRLVAVEELFAEETLDTFRI